MGGVEGHAARAKKHASTASSNMKIMGAGIKAASAGRKVYKEVEETQKKAQAEKEQGVKPDPTKTKEQLETEQAMLAAQKFEDSLPAILDLAWAINVRDIGQTLKRACKKLFADASVDMEMRKKRAQAIKIIGHEFLSVGKSVGKDAVDAKDKKQIWKSLLNKIKRWRLPKLLQAPTKQMLKLESIKKVDLQLFENLFRFYTLFVSTY